MDTRHIFVSENGNDQNEGTMENPFKTLEKARDTAKFLKDSVNSGEIIVYIREGNYFFKNSFIISKENSGTASCPIIYKSFNSEKVNFWGGIKIDAEKLKTVADESLLNRLHKESRGKVMEFSLECYEDIDFCPVSKGQFNGSEYVNDISGSEIFFDDYEMMPARYPNEGFLTIKEVLDRGDEVRYWREDMKNQPEYVPLNKRPSAPRGGIFTVDDNRVERYKNAEDIFVSGYFRWDWYQEVLGVDSIDIEKKAVKTTEPSLYSFTEGQRFYFFNLFEEIDMPGEWYYDKKRKTVYLYPHPVKKDTKIMISTLRSPFIIIDNASYVSFEGINFEFGRADGIKASDCLKINISDCKFTKTAGTAINISGRNITIKGCEILNIGQGGIFMEGGCRETLLSSGNLIEGNKISKTDRIKKSYAPCIHISGVGITVRKNELFDMDHCLMFFGGNDNIIEENHFHDGVKLSEDMGALYAMRDLTQRGNIIRNNFFENIISFKENVNAHQVHAIYQDDEVSGSLITGNVFSNVSNGIFINGGRDNIITNNIFTRINDEAYPVIIANWAMRPEILLNLAIKTPYDNVDYTKMSAITYGLKDVPYNKEPYTKYDNLANILEDELAFPKYNVVMDNLYTKTKNGTFIMLYGKEKLVNEDEILKRNTIERAYMVPK